MMRARCSLIMPFQRELARVLHCSPRRGCGIGSYGGRLPGSCARLIERRGYWRVSVYFESMAAPLQSIARACISRHAIGRTSPRRTSPCRHFSLDVHHGQRFAEGRGARKGRDGEESGQQEASAAVVIGWMGAQDKHLKKVASVYTTGSRPLIDPNRLCVFQPSMMALFSEQQRRQELHAFQERVRRLPSSQSLQSGENRTKKLLLHCMSNNGFFFLASVLNEINSANDAKGGAFRGLFDEFDSVKLVIDSAPSNIDGDIAARGVLSALMRESSKQISDRYPLLYAVSKSLLSRFISSATMTQKLREVQQHAWYELSRDTC